MHGEPAASTDREAQAVEQHLIPRLQERAAEILRSTPSLAGVQVGAVGNASSLGRFFDFRKDLVLIFRGKAPGHEGSPSSPQPELSALCIEVGVRKEESKPDAESLAKRVAGAISGAAHECGGSGHFAPASPFVVPLRDVGADECQPGPGPCNGADSTFMVVRFVAPGFCALTEV